jgi:hypothetical protein
MQVQWMSSGVCCVLSAVYITDGLCWGEDGKLFSKERNPTQSYRGRIELCTDDRRFAHGDTDPGVVIVSLVCRSGVALKRLDPYHKDR